MRCPKLDNLCTPASLPIESEHFLYLINLHPQYSEMKDVLLQKLPISQRNTHLTPPLVWLVTSAASKDRNTQGVNTENS